MTVQTEGFSITLPTGNEYTYSKTAVTDFSSSTWSEAGTVTGLDVNTKYFIYQRVKATATHKASPVSPAAEGTTLKYDIADVISSVSIGTNGTAGTVLTPDVTYAAGFNAAKAGTLSYEWSNSLTTANYTITATDVSAENAIYVTVSAANCTGTKDSNTVTAGKAAYTGTVQRPSVTASGTGFVINNIPLYQYAVMETNTSPAETDWVDFGTGDVTVTGKTPNKTYYIFSRVKGTATVMPSAASVVRSVRVLNDDCDLKSLTASGVTLTPAFDKTVTDYTINVLLGGTVKRVTAAANDSNATVTVVQAKNLAADNVATVTVTSENGAETKTYTVTFTEEERSDVPVITTDNTVNISRSGTIEITGSGDIYYTLNGLTPSTSSTKYTGPIDISKLNFSATATGFTVKAVAKETGKAISTVASKTFSFKDTNASLSSITVNGTPVAGFRASKLSYDYVVSYADWCADKSKVYTVIGKTAQPTSSVQNPAEAVISSTDPTVNSSDVMEITVTSENGDKIKYSVNFIITACTHAIKTTTVVTQPACGTPGLERVTCDLCSAEVSKRTLSPLAHSYTSTVETQADCTHPEITRFTCRNCLDTYTVETAPATGHNFSTQETVDIPASCTGRGYSSFHCQNAGCTAVTGGSSAPALGHTWSNWTTTDSTNYTRTCSVCSTTETYTATNTSHIHVFNGTHETITAATCKDDGSEKIYCSEPGCTDFITSVIAATNLHDFETVVSGTADCTNDGRTADKCKICGITENNCIVPATGHSWGSYVGDTATCLNGGYATAACSRCSQTSQISTPAKPHIESAWIIERPVSATDAGWRYKECTVCHARLQESAIANAITLSIQSSVSATGSLTKGTSCTLTASAAGASTTPNYQWYRNSLNSTTGGTPVGAAAPTYNVDTNTEGTYYYYCKADGATSNIIGITVVAPSTPPVTPPVTPSVPALPSQPPVYLGNGLPPISTVSARYSIISGAGSEWEKGSKEGLTFKADGSFGKFTGVKIDNKALTAPNDYTAGIGSTIVKIQPAYLEKLSEGMHTITVMYVDGSATATFETYGEAVDVSPEAGVHVNEVIASENGRNGTIVVIAICCAAMLAASCFASYTVRKKK